MKSAKLSQIIDKDLAKAGVKDRLHQKILISEIPCGIETALEALMDCTDVSVNAARALMVYHWKGMVKAFALLEKYEKV
jgi:hypothetical protein